MTNCLILKVKKLEFLRAPVRSPRTVSAFGRGYLEMHREFGRGYLEIHREINVQKNRRMHERVIEVFLWRNISAVRKIPVCDSGNGLSQDPVSSHCL